MLRLVVIALAGLLLGGAVLSLTLGNAPAAAPMAVFGALLLLGTLFERARYKRIAEDAPGPGWEATGERFRDPVSGATVDVWFNPVSGERRYARAPIGAPPPRA